MNKSIQLAWVTVSVLAVLTTSGWMLVLSLISLSFASALIFARFAKFTKFK
jgi:hypothetical protein